MKTGVLLINLGTPDSPSYSAVYRYLIEFLTDPYVIGGSWLKRQLLVRGIIVPLRFRQSTSSYAQIWMPEGSPLKVYGERLKRLLQERLGNGFAVELAMRYQRPSIATGIANLVNLGVQKLIVIPLFPQYAAATTGSIYEEVTRSIKRTHKTLQVRFLDQFAADSGFIEAVQAQSASMDLNSYDHILFSFHGLPKKQLAGSPYLDHCTATADALAARLNLSSDKITVCFQSRLGKDPWIEPYASDVLDKLAIMGAKRLAVFCPSFVCDCLETLFEYGVEYAHEFKRKGGETLDLVPGLNDSPLWVEALAGLVKQTDR